MEAEAYDYLESVEGSVMNHSEAGDLEFKIYERNESLSRFSD